MTGPLVVGLGNRDRGDDGIGPEVARRVRALELTGVRVVEQMAPLDLLHAWDRDDRVVLVDAMSSGRSVGSVVVLDATEALPVGSGVGGTHGAGLAAVVELARAVERLPARLVVVGVEGRDFGFGERLSEAVRAAVEPAVRAVASVLAELATGD